MRTDQTRRFITRVDDNTENGRSDNGERGGMKFVAEENGRNLLPTLICLPRTSHLLSSAAYFQVTLIYLSRILYCFQGQFMFVHRRIMIICKVQLAIFELFVTVLREETKRDLLTQGYQPAARVTLVARVCSLSAHTKSLLYKLR